MPRLDTPRPALIDMLADRSHSGGPAGLQVNWLSIGEALNVANEYHDREIVVVLRHFIMREHLLKDERDKLIVAVCNVFTHPDHGDECYGDGYCGCGHEKAVQALYDLMPEEFRNEADE